MSKKGYTLLEYLVALEKKLNDLEKYGSGTDNSFITNLENQINDLKNRVSNSETDISNIETEINSLDTEITNLQRQYNQEKIIDLELQGNILKLKNINGSTGVGVELQITSGGGSTGEVDESYDLEVNLPFTPTSDTKVQLEISDGVAESYNSETNSNINLTDSWTVSTSNVEEYVFEATSYLGKNCLHFSKDTSTTGYCTIKSDNPNGRLLDKTHKYYSRFDFCLIADGANDNYPNLYGAKSFSASIDTSKLNQWQTFSEIQTPTNNTNEANLRAMVDGECYFTGILIDLTLNNIETKTLEQLDEMYENGEFNVQLNPQFSCIINNGSVTKTIQPFNSNTITEVVTVSAGNTLKITKNGSYPLANVIAKVNSSTSDVEIEDVDFILNTRFRGKKAVFEGDSITDPSFASYYNGKTWANYVINKLKIGDYLIPAKGGASISTFNITNSVVNRVQETNYPNGVKLFCVFAGTNDWGENVALGTKDSEDISTVLGALNTIIKTIQTKCPDADIVIISPIHRYGDTAIHNEYNLYDVAKGYQEVCEKYGVTFVNGLSNFGIRNYGSIEENYLLKDGLHPTEAGQKRIGTRIAGIISTL